MLSCAAPSNENAMLSIKRKQQSMGLAEKCTGDNFIDRKYGANN